MALLLPEAAKRTRNATLAAIIKNIALTDQMANVIPMVGVGTTPWEYTREGTLPDTTFIPDTGASTENSTGTDDVVSVQLRRIAGNMDVDNLANDLAGPTGPGSSTDNQLLKKSKTTWRKIKDKMVNGGHTTSHTFGAGTPTSITLGIDSATYGPWLDSSRFGAGVIKYVHIGTFWSFRAPGDVDFGDAVAVTGDSTVTLRSHNRNKHINVTIDVSDATANAEGTIYFVSTTDEFDGMKNILDPSQLLTTAGANGDAFSLAMLDALITEEKIDSNRAFILNGGLIEKFYASLRALGGITPEHVVLPGFNTSRVPTYRGIPLLRNDNILNDEVKGSGTTLSSIYLASLDADEGLCLGVANEGGDTLNVDGDPNDTLVMGFRIDELGPLETADHNRTRVKWYGALGLKSTLALVRQPEVVTA